MTFDVLAVWLAFEEPRWLWLVLLVPVLIVLSRRALAALDTVRRVSAVAARCAVIVVLAASLARVVTVRTNKSLTVMFLMDRSLSVRELQAAQEEYIHSVCAKVPEDDRVGVIDFARHAYLEQLPMRGGVHLEPGRLPVMPHADRTDVAGAIRLAMAMFPHDTAKRIVLLSDGNGNMGDLLAEARRARADGVAIDVVPLRYQHRNEVRFEKLIAPSAAQKNEMIPLRMLLHSRRHASGTIDLYHNGRKVELPGGYAHVDLPPGTTPFMLKVPVGGEGPQRFEARFVPDAPSMDEVPDNNQATAFSFVGGPQRVLFLSYQPQMDEPLVRALGDEGINVVQRDARTATLDPVELTTYSAVVLANVPANVFTDEQQKTLAGYVTDMGGGLLLTGGDESFGAGGWIGSPVEEVVPITFEIKHKKVLPRGALVLIMHSCEIPRGNFWGKEVAKKSVDTISTRDYLGILAYTWSPGGVNWEVPLALVQNKRAVKTRIDRMQIGDMPDFDTTVRLAYQALAQTDAAQKHMIVISDGDPSPPSPRVISDLVEAKITVSTIGIGYGRHVMESTLRAIANQTKGRFYACKNPRLLPQIFVKESKVVRRPLIVNEPFAPRQLHTMSEVLTGIAPDEVLPELGGLVLTSPKPDPRVQLPLVRVTKDGNDPVLAHWQQGLGKATVFTSGFWPVWGGQWTAWPKFPKLWAQIVRWTMRQETPANFDVVTRTDGDKGRIVVEALDKDANYLNFLNLRSRLIRPDQSVVPVSFIQTGPGRYEATFTVDQTGSYIATVGVFEGSEYHGAIHTGLSVPFSPEFRELATNESLLHRVAEVAGGRVLQNDPATDDVFSHDLPPTVARQAAWDWTVAWLLLPLFLLDVAVRRLANWLAFSIFVELVVLAFLLFGVGLAYGTWWGMLGAVVLAEVIGWSIRFRYIGPFFGFLTHTVTVLGRTGQRSTVALEQLKGTRERVREERTGRGDVSAAPTGGAVAPPPGPAGRYEADESPATSASGDLAEQLGGASSGEAAAPKHRRPPSAGDDQAQKESEDVTRRLLRAKRRKRQDADEND